MLTSLKGLTTSLGVAVLLGLALPSQAQEDAADATADQQAQMAPIDINSADAALLSELPGIGEVKAAAIVENRKANGPFESATDLTRVSGIGDATAEGLEDQVTF